MNVQLATIVRNIEPSSQTYQQTYSQASKFASENRDLEGFPELQSQHWASTNAWHLFSS